MVCRLALWHEQHHFCLVEGARKMTSHRIRLNNITTPTMISPMYQQLTGKQQTALRGPHQLVAAACKPMH